MAMTAIEIFDRVQAALVEQGGASRSATGMCQYRGTDGRKCAVGVLVDDEWAEMNEGWSLAALKRPLPAELAPFAKLLTRLQTIHDGEMPISRDAVPMKWKQWQLHMDSLREDVVRGVYDPVTA